MGVSEGTSLTLFGIVSFQIISEFGILYWRRGKVNSYNNGPQEDKSGYIPQPFI